MSPEDIASADAAREQNPTKAAFMASRGDKYEYSAVLLERTREMAESLGLPSEAAAIKEDIEKSRAWAKWAEEHPIDLGNDTQGQLKPSSFGIRRDLREVGRELLWLKDQESKVPAEKRDLYDQMVKEREEQERALIENLKEQREENGRNIEDELAVEELLDSLDDKA